jgi:hypothetical protein
MCKQFKKKSKCGEWASHPDNIGAVVFLLDKGDKEAFLDKHLKR